MNLSIAFEQQGVFQAVYAAEAWLKARGFSIGSSQGPEPRAIWHGDCYISKWRGLSAVDKREMHAQMTGDQRNGPVKVALCDGATPEAIIAFSLEAVA